MLSASFCRAKMSKSFQVKTLHTQNVKWKGTLKVCGVVFLSSWKNSQNVESVAIGQKLWTFQFYLSLCVQTSKRTLSQETGRPKDSVWGLGGTAPSTKLCISCLVWALPWSWFFMRHPATDPSFKPALETPQSTSPDQHLVVHSIHSSKASTHK